MEKWFIKNLRFQNVLEASSDACEIDPMDFHQNIPNDQEWSQRAMKARIVATQILTEQGYSSKEIAFGLMMERASINKYRRMLRGELANDQGFKMRVEMAKLNLKKANQ